MGMKSVVYSHSDYSFVWPYWVKQSKKYYPNLLDGYTFLNRKSDQFSGMPIITYDESKCYRDRVIECLNSLDSNQVILYHHEDMFLYDYPSITKLNEFTELVEDDKCDFVKLIACGNYFVRSDLHENLFLVSPDLKFSIQPTIIKVGKLLDIFKFSCAGNLWQTEQSMFNSPIVKNGLFCYSNESRRGSSHFDSTIYPYIATAIVKGKWNVMEYKKELQEILC